MTPDDLIESFLEFKCVNRGRSERTAAAYRLALSRLVEFFGDRDPLDASHDDLTLFTGAWLFKKGLEATSRRPHVAAVREFYKWLLDTKRIRGNPAEGIQYPQTGLKLPRVMTLQNAEKLMWAPDFSTFEGVRDGAMFSLLVGCGMRISGLVGMNQSGIIKDEIEGKVRLIAKVTEKGKRDRKIPIPPQADLQLRLYLEHPDLKDIDRTLPSGDQVLFVSTRNRTCPPHEYIGDRRRLNRRAVLESIKKYGSRAGIPDDQLHPHALRHLFGTELAESDVDMLTRQQLMGHADPKSTAIYTHLAMRKLARDSDRSNPLAKMRTPVSDLLRRLEGKKG